MKFPLFYRLNAEIQSRKIQNYIYYFELSCSGFPRWRDKREGISKIFLSFFNLFLYILWRLYSIGLPRVTMVYHGGGFLKSILLEAPFCVEPEGACLKNLISCKNNILYISNLYIVLTFLKKNTAIKTAVNNNFNSCLRYHTTIF